MKAKWIMAATLAASMSYASQAPMFAADPAPADQPAANADAGAQPADPGAQPADPTAQPGEAGDMDRMFVEKAASGGMLEVATSQLALERAQNDQVKQFAQRMIDDHTKANQELMQVAMDAGFELPKMMTPVHQAMLDELSQLQGQQFERAYTYGQVADHAKMVLKFRDAAHEAQNEAVKQFAAKQLPHLREHLVMAGQLAGIDKELEQAGHGKHGENQGQPAGGAGDAGGAGGAGDAGGAADAGGQGGSK